MRHSSSFKLFLIFLLIISLKLILSSFVLAPSAVNDGYVFSKMSQSFFDDQDFSVHGVSTAQYPPLYPMVLSFSFLLNNMLHIFTTLKIINITLSSLIIFPAYLLAREFLPKSKALLATLIVGFLPSHFITSNFLLSENLFYTLFLFTFYFAYLAFKTNQFKFFLTLGMFTGLSFLTRPTAIAFVPIIALMFLYQIFKKEFKFSNLFITSTAFVLLITPWLLRNGFKFGWSIAGLLGKVYVSDVSTNNATSFLSHFISIDWMFLYAGTLILAGLFLFPLATVFFFKKHGFKKHLSVLTILTFFFFIFIAAAHGSSSDPNTANTVMGRLLHTRHIDQLLPLLIIFGFTGLSFIKKQSVKLLTPLLLIPPILAIFQLSLNSQRFFPPNNGSLTGFGIVIEGLSSFSPLLTTLIITTALFILISILSIKYKQAFPYIFLTLMIVTSTAGSALVAYNAYDWASTEHKELGLYLDLNSNKNDLIVYDQESCVHQISRSNQQGLCEHNNLFIPSAFWINSNIRLGTKHQATKYFISSKQLNLPLEKQFNNFRVYNLLNQKKGVKPE